MEEKIDYNRLSSLINESKEILAKSIMGRQYVIQPELLQKYGDYEREKCIEDTIYHLTYLSEAISLNKKNLFLDYVKWFKPLFRKLGVSNKGLIVNLENISYVLENALLLTNEEKLLIDDYINSAIYIINSPEESKIDYIHHNNPLKGIAEKYLNYLLEGDRNSASNLILDEVKSGISIKDIYIYVFQNSLYEIGHLWETNQINVAQEHYFTAATQLIMSQLYPYIFNTKKKGISFVSASVSGELHEIGIRMISDFLELDGWDTYYLGANNPVSGIINSLIKYKAKVLGISCTMTYHLNKVREIINGVRTNNNLTNVKILVGGRAFKTDNDLWKSIGADGFAQNAQEVSNALQKILAEEQQ